MRIGILNGGGDCPGLNAVTRAVVLTSRLRHDDDVIGYLDGWKGVLEGAHIPLGVERCREILTIGGTILGTSRTNPYKVDGGPERVTANLRGNGVDALIAVGARTPWGWPTSWSQQGVPVVGVPKTIDNDLAGHRGHLRVRHRRADRHRRHRPAPHHRRVAPPRHRLRGDGAPRRVDRHLRRHRRRCGRDPRARGARSSSTRSATACAGATSVASSRRSWSCPRGRPRRRARRRGVGEGDRGCVLRRLRPRAPRRDRHLGGRRDRAAHRVRVARRRSSATSSGAGRPRRSTASWPPASAWRPSRRSTTARSG